MYSVCTNVYVIYTNVRIVIYKKRCHNMCIFSVKNKSEKRPVAISIRIRALHVQVMLNLLILLFSINSSTVIIVAYSFKTNYY